MEREQLQAAVKALDPAPSDAATSEDLWSAAVVLRAIDTRSGIVTKTETRPEKMEPASRWRPALVAAAAFVAVIAIGALVWLAAVRDTAPPVEQTTTTQAPATTIVTDEAAGPAPISTGFGSLEAGAHRLDSFGTPIIFSTESSAFFVQENSGGFFAMSAPNSRDPDDRDMVILKLTGLSDPTAPNAARADQGEGWPADDFGGWLDNLPAGVIVTNREATTLGGLPAVQVDLELGDIECAPGNSFCVLFDWGQRKILNPGAEYRVWVVDEGLESPIAVVLGTTGHPSDASWLEAYEGILSTFEFGTTESP